MVTPSRAIGAARGGALSAGDVAMFLAAAAGVRTALAGLTTAVSGGQARLLAFAHYVAVVGAGSDLPRADGADAPPLRRGIEMRAVWFRHGDDRRRPRRRPRPAGRPAPRLRHRGLTRMFALGEADEAPACCCPAGCGSGSRWPGPWSARAGPDDPRRARSGNLQRERVQEEACARSIFPKLGEGGKYSMILVFDLSVLIERFDLDAM